MTAHELARALLEMPDVEVIFYDTWNQPHSVYRSIVGSKTGKVVLDTYQDCTPSEEYEWE